MAGDGSFVDSILLAVRAMRGIRVVLIKAREAYDQQRLHKKRIKNVDCRQQTAADSILCLTGFGLMMEKDGSKMTDGERRLPCWISLLRDCEHNKSPKQLGTEERYGLFIGHLQPSSDRGTRRIDVMIAGER